MRHESRNGLIAGLVAALASGGVAVLATVSGWSPEFNPPALLARLFGETSSANPAWAAFGWALHFLVYGVGLGVLFAALGRWLDPIGYGVRGILFALATWAGAAFVFMPLAGAGLFGMNLGYATVPVLLIAHLVFGLALGETYAKLEHIRDDVSPRMAAPPRA
jgi:hypothetical protein